MCLNFICLCEVIKRKRDVNTFINEKINFRNMMKLLFVIGISCQVINLILNVIDRVKRD